MDRAQEKPDRLSNLSSIIKSLDEKECQEFTHGYKRPIYGSVKTVIPHDGVAVTTALPQPEV